MTATCSGQAQGPGPIACETAARRLWDHIDGRLPELARNEVEAHLAICSLCAPRFAFARVVKHALGEIGAHKAPAQLDGEECNALGARIQEALRRARAGDG